MNSPFDPNFQFLNFDPPREGQVWLELREKIPANPEKNYVPSYAFDIRKDGLNESLGHINARIGDTESLLKYAGHIGYAVKEKFRNQGLATQACHLVFSIFKLHGVQRLIITCSPNNKASARVCEKAGGQYLGENLIPEDHEMREEPGRTHSKVFEFHL